MDRPLGRRLHTISGAIVLGAFLVEHLLTQASVLGGAASYDHIAGALSRSAMLSVFDLLFVVLPLGYHAIFGLTLLRKPANEAPIERYGVRRLWILQRITAVVLFVFVLVHLWELRFQRLFFGLGADGLYSLVTSHLSSTWAGIPGWALFYLLGLAAACTHFGNGLGATVEPRFRRIGLVFAGLLFVIGMATVLGFATGTTLFQGPEGPAAAPCGSAVPIASSRP